MKLLYIVVESGNYYFDSYYLHYKEKFVHNRSQTFNCTFQQKEIAKKKITVENFNISSLLSSTFVSFTQHNF